TQQVSCVCYESAKESTSCPSKILDAQVECSQPLIGFGVGLDCQHGNPCGGVGLSDCERFGLLWEVKQWQEDEVKEEGNVKTSTTEYEDHDMTVEIEKEFEVKGLKVCVGNITYECDFMVLEDTTSVIDHDLGSVIFRKPFVEATGLVYDREEGTITFEKDKEKIVFKMPHKMEMFKHIDFMDMKTDRIPPFVIESDDDSSKKTHYSDSLDLGLEYKHDENICRAIWSLIAMKAKRSKGEVT
ncbi:hypothetical protein Tco_1382941, partial [Tanacetum coccineum]